ncbi:MAG: hypothetical protein GX892_10060 [Thermoanaerobacteraceae bacterium]|nr:hypothetical protein [Thermoanaerobacteraceae bacterium]
MSRDWRPFELFIADLELAEKGTPLREQNFYFVTNDEKGNEVKTLLGNEKAKEIYPEISFLFNGFDSVFEKHHSDEAYKVYDAFEKALTQIQNDFKETLTVPESKELHLLTEEEFLKQPIEDVVKEWFYGHLDDGFYYSIENDRAMELFLVNKIDESRMISKGKNKKNVERE